MGFFSRNDVERRRGKSPGVVRQKNAPPAAQAQAANGTVVAQPAAAAVAADQPMMLGTVLQAQQLQPTMIAPTITQNMLAASPTQNFGAAAAGVAAVPDCQQIIPGMWLGSCRAVKLEFLQASGINFVMNTARELKGREIIDWEVIRRAGIHVMHLGWEDSMQQQVYPSKTLNDAVVWVDQVLGSGNRILIHCAQGRSRSCTMVIAYLLIRQGYSYDAALAIIQSKRPIAQPNPNFEQQLRSIERSVEMRNKSQGRLPHTGERMQQQPQPGAMVAMGPHTGERQQQQQMQQHPHAGMAMMPAAAAPMAGAPGHHHHMTGERHHMHHHAGLPAAHTGERQQMNAAQFAQVRPHPHAFAYDQQPQQQLQQQPQQPMMFAGFDQNALKQQQQQQQMAMNGGVQAFYQPSQHLPMRVPHHQHQHHHQQQPQQQAVAPMQGSLQRVPQRRHSFHGGAGGRPLPQQQYGGQIVY